MKAYETGVQEKKRKKTSRIAIVSLIFALLGSLFFFTFLRLIMFLHPAYRPFRIATVLFFSTSVALAIISFIAIAINRKKSKGSLFAIGAILIWIFILIMLLPLEVSMARHRQEVIGSKLKTLYRTITEYSEIHDGYLPDADEWCNLLTKYDRNLPMDTFKYPSGKFGVFIFAFNKNLNGLRLEDIPNNVVLLFEVDHSLYSKIQNSGACNLAGKAELLKVPCENKQSFFVLFADGTTHNSRNIINELRWKP